MSKPFTLHVDGMHCAGCVRRVQIALEKVPGVVVDDAAVGKVTGSFEPDEAGPADLESAVTKAGYPAHVVESAGEGSGA